MAVKEEIYEYLKAIKEKAEVDIKNNYIGYEDYKVKTVKHFNKDIELLNRKTKKVEKFDLTIVELQNPKNSDEIRVLYYLNGEEVNYTDLLIEYETEEPIRDSINEAIENKKKPVEKQDEKLEMQDLEELEKEKEEEKQKEADKKKTDKDKKEEERKPKYIIQTIDTDAYSDNIETIHRAFRLPPNVKQLAFAYPNKEDKKELGSGVTLYMLDGKGNIIDGTEKYFKVDDATGKNPMHDDSTELELDETGERHEGKTMRRFRSTQRPDQYLSVKQKEVGQYNEVYADRKEETENSSIGNQVETRNVEIQTSLEMQTINSTYKGVFHPDDIDKEVDKHEKHDDDIDNTSKKNLDGLEHTKEPCEKNIYLLYECVAELKGNDEYIRENFSDESIIKTLMYNIDKNPNISREELMEETSTVFHNSKIYQENKDKYPTNHKEKDDEGNEFYREGLWSSAKH